MIRVSCIKCFFGIPLPHCWYTTSNCSSFLAVFRYAFLLGVDSNPAAVRRLRRRFPKGICRDDVGATSDLAICLERMVMCSNPAAARVFRNCGQKIVFETGVYAVATRPGTLPLCCFDDAVVAVSCQGSCWCLGRFTSHTTAWLGTLGHLASCACIGFGPGYAQIELPSHTSGTRACVRGLPNHS